MKTSASRKLIAGIINMRAQWRESIHVGEQNRPELISSELYSHSVSIGS